MILLRFLWLFFAFLGLFFLVPGLIAGFERAPVETGCWVAFFVVLVVLAAFDEAKKNR